MISGCESKIGPPWISGVRTEVDDSLLIVQNYRAPLNCFAASKLAGITAIDVDNPEMAPINVTAIGVEKDAFAIWRQRPLLHLAITGSEQAWRSAINRKGVQMLPAVLFGGDQQPILRGPKTYSAPSVLGHERIGS